LQTIAKQLLRIATLIVLSGLACACLVRYAPGALVDERELNQRAGEGTLAALREHKAQQRDVGATFLHYLRGMTHGDLGFSESNNTPIASLLTDRAPRTLRDLGFGLAGAWLLGLGFAIPVALFPRAWRFDAALTLSAGLLLSLPAALVAYFCLLTGTASQLVSAIVLSPKIFQYSRNILVSAYGAPHVEMGRARGIPESGILWMHVLPSVAPQLGALAAASVSIAIGAAIPIEAICDVPGLGRLAWQAAMARDLPLLINLTMLVTLATTSAMAISEIFLSRRTEFDPRGAA
jgi:peptide/nickel transport system permease protein